MPASGRPEEITHWTGTGGNRRKCLAPRQEMPELAVLDQAPGKLVATGRIVEELERDRAAGDAPQETEMLGRRRAHLVGCDPDIDATRVGRNLCVRLHGAVAFEQIANHLLAEPIVPRTHHRGDHRTT